MASDFTVTWQKIDLYLKYLDAIEVGDRSQEPHFEIGCLCDIVAAVLQNLTVDLLAPRQLKSNSEHCHPLLC
jgi:hypothetical protein